MARGVAAHGLFDDLVGREVDGVCGSWIMLISFSVLLLALQRIRMDAPAPKTTLDSPRHSDIYPSTLEMVAIALPMPLYIAAGVGLTTCIRVCHRPVSRSSHLSLHRHPDHTLSKSIGYITECSYSHYQRHPLPTACPHISFYSQRSPRKPRRPCSRRARSSAVGIHSYSDNQTRQHWFSISSQSWC